MKISKKELGELCKAMDDWAEAEYYLGYAHGERSLCKSEAHIQKAAFERVLKLLKLNRKEFCDLRNELND